MALTAGCGGGSGGNSACQDAVTAVNQLGQQATYSSLAVGHLHLLLTTAAEAGYQHDAQQWSDVKSMGLTTVRQQHARDLLVKQLKARLVEDVSKCH